MGTEQLKLLSEQDERHGLVSRVLDVGTIALGVLIDLAAIPLSLTGDKSVGEGVLALVIGTSVAAIGVHEFRQGTEQNKQYVLQFIAGQQGSDTV